MIRVSKAPSGLNRHKYVCLQANMQHHIFVSVGAKHPFDTLIYLSVVYSPSAIKIGEILTDNSYNAIFK